MIIHLVSGLYILIMTIIFSLLAFNYYGWEYIAETHSILGILSLVMVLFIIIIGFIT